MLHEYLPQLLLAWSIQWMGVLSPGPGVMLILGVATTAGRGPALVTTFGIACGAVMLAIATVLGLATQVSQIAWAMTMIKLIGAAYLAWLAWGSFKKALNPPELIPRAVETGSAWRTALGGFTMQITNPKAIFFWLAVAAAGGIGDAPAHIVALFLTGAFVNSYLGHGVYALLLSSNPIRAAYSRFRRWIEGALGVFFTIFSVKLALSRG
ncbi:LysE family translocator [Halovulum sp. GXIMD14793]